MLNFVKNLNHHYNPKKSTNLGKRAIIHNPNTIKSNLRKKKLNKFNNLIYTLMFKFSQIHNPKPKIRNEILIEKTIVVRYSKP
jgi:hypothetical protein